MQAKTSAWPLERVMRVLSHALYLQGHRQTANGGMSERLLGHTLCQTRVPTDEVNHAGSSQRRLVTHKGVHSKTV